MSEYAYNVSLMQQKSSRAFSSVSSQYEGQIAWTDWDLETVARQGYKKNTVCYGAISDLASSAASVNFTLKNSSGTFFEKHPLLDLLNRPNPFQGKHEFWEAVYAFRWMSGNAYIEGADLSKSRSPSKIQELYCLPPQNLRVLLGRIGIQGYRFSYNGRDIDFPVDMISGKSSIMHWKSFNPTNLWYGMSPLEAAGIALDMFNDSNMWNRSLLKNGARPSGAITFKDDDGGMLTDEQFERLEKQVQNKYAGSNAAGKILLLEGGLYWQQMSMTPHDMDFLNSRNTTARDVASALQYPAMLLNIPGDNTYSNQKEARLALWEDTIIPSMVAPLCSHLTRWLSPYFGNDLIVGYDEDAITALQPRRDSTWKRAQRSEWVTINEKRKMTGLPPISGGDVLLVGTNVAPLGVVVSQTQLPSVTPPPVKSQVDSRLDLLQKSLKPMSFKKNENVKELQEHIRIQDSLESIYATEIEDVLDSVLKEALRKYAMGAGANSIYITYNENEPELVKRIKEMYRGTMRVASARVFEAFKNSSCSFEVKESRSTFEAFADLWIEKEALKAATSIFETSKDQVRNILIEGVIQGWSTNEMGDSIYEKLGGETSRARSRLIARTEVHRSFNVASQEAVKTTGVPVKKRWLAADDERTRETHATADEFNGDIEIDDYFQVGHSKMLYPGDSDAEAKETINCRCSVRHIPIFEGEEDE